ncbi:MAG TPA: NUDIX hydrolase [Pseudolabrys sp.]|nr:NUDIX hydrolase [Pseudolabrys sp.]
MSWPKILNRTTRRLSPWVKIIERSVEFRPQSSPELYHALGQQDYVAILAMTPDGFIPIVRQYRPAVEGFTWELPAGMVDENETPEACCRRELAEETGLSAIALHALGSFHPCTARLSNRVHSFFVHTGPRAAALPAEPELEIRFVKPDALAELIAKGDFVLQLHIGALLLAGMGGHIDLGAFRLPPLA